MTKPASETTAMERLSLIGTLTTLSPSLSFDNAPQQQLPKLPFDLVTEILCWLPVKSLLRLRCVCKSWNSLISEDAKFAKKHLQASITRNRYRLILTSMNYSDELVFCDSTVPSFANTVCITTSFTLNKYPPIPYYGFRTGLGVSSCDGIVCCVSSASAILCNPSTRKFKLLPPFEIPFDYTLFSFGYHHFTKTYKIVAVSRNVDENLPETNYVSVHTLGTDFWRKIEDFPSYAYTYILASGIFVSNRVNWLAYDSRTTSSRVIISLDLDTESYHELLQPNYGTVNGILGFHNFNLGVLMDCLCILSPGDTSTSVWLMKEYGNEDSWTKLFNLPYIYIDDVRPCFYTKIVCISEDDQVLLLEFIEDGEVCLVLYDSKNNTFKNPEIQNTNSYLVASQVYIERLISPFS